jgi:hypothetical protein
MSERAAKSLLDGRNTAPLTDHEIRRASSTFMGLDNQVNVRHEAGATTRFVTRMDEYGEEFGEVIFSSDLYPGTNIANPNSSLSMKAAAAHELAHFYRWTDKSELPHGVLTHIDEAMTSLEAAIRYAIHLSPTDVHGLISDALQRLRLYVADQPLAPAETYEGTNAVAAMLPTGSAD